MQNGSEINQASACILGFKVWFLYDRYLSDVAIDALDEEWLVGIIEARGLSFGGGGQDAYEWEGFVTRRDGRTATEDDRKAVEDWLRSAKDVEKYRVGLLEDSDSPTAGL